jgi:hypothetical protein
VELRGLRTLALTVAVAAVAVAACGGDRSGTAGDGSNPLAADPPALGQVPVLNDARDVSLPLDHYRATEEQAYTLTRAREMLTVDCMRRFGFNRSLSPPVAKSPGPGGRYGISYGPEVDRYGYHQPPERVGPPRPPRDPNNRPSAAELGVERGEGLTSHNGQAVPRGGCLGEADRALGGETGEGGTAPALDSSDMFTKLRLQARNATDADVRLLEVFGKWSECMKKAGYSYRSPWDANDDPAFQGEISAKEIATAQADLRCRIEFNVNGLYFALEEAYQRRAIEQNLEPLRAEKAKLDERIRKATDIVAGTR